MAKRIGPNPTNPWVSTAGNTDAFNNGWGMGRPHTLAFWDYGDNISDTTFWNGGEGHGLGWGNAAPHFAITVEGDPTAGSHSASNYYPNATSAGATGGRPHHLASVTYSKLVGASGFVVLTYMDGFLVDRVTTSATPGLNPFYRYMNSAADVQTTWDLTVFNDALAPWEVRALAKGAPPWVVRPQNIYYMWPFNGMVNSSGQDRMWPTSQMYAKGATDTFAAYVSAKVVQTPDKYPHNVYGAYPLPFIAAAGGQWTSRVRHDGPPQSLVVA